MIFRRKKAPPVPSSRDALLAVDRALAEARQRVAEKEATVERLRRVIAAEGPARAAVQHAVAADGGASLADGDPQIAALLATAEAASRAAAAASNALPDAERELSEAAAAAVRLAEREKREAIDGVLIAEAERVGQEYAAAFAKLMAAYERLTGIDRALGGKIALAGVEPIEMPRFSLRSTPAPSVPLLQGGWTKPGENWSTYLRHVPSEQKIARYAAAWSAARSHLAADPGAFIGDLLAADPPTEMPEEPTPAYTRRVRTDAPAHAVPPHLVAVADRPGETILVPTEPPRERRHRTR